MEMDATGKIIVDTSRLYMDDPRAGVNQFNDPGAFLERIERRAVLGRGWVDARAVAQGEVFDGGQGMAEENGEGKKRTGLLDRVREDAEDIKEAVKEKGKEEIEGLKEPEKTQLYPLHFPRQARRDPAQPRAFGVLSNVFFHLHPAKVNRDAVKYNYTWGMGGITFYLFIVLTFTGVLLMFYYHPTKVQAFRDILYLENDVPFGKLLRNMHRWAAHLMIIAVWLHMFRVFLTGSYKRPREFNWCIGVLLMVLTLLLSFTGYLLPDDQLGFWAVTVGTNMARATPLLGNEGPVRRAAGHDAVQRRALRACWAARSWTPTRCLRAYIWHCIAIPLIACDLHGRAFLARAQGRRNFRPRAGHAGIGNQGREGPAAGDHAAERHDLTMRANKLDGAFRAQKVCR